ncbi:GNAT family N-acetyltransferase [Porphyrobacter algicida]|uniref:GNAT family N-acetyltransferase n=1 Tax=Qipengyuania algicida TaxID=1836209 RepID=A0A845AJA3_9SPHN|nr:GNAT family N-acetyltransferase [Qipengyuania algicida]MXP29243.1 GNAT family N-acetyltransferase [Qipengyuania algicida]
MSPETIDLGTGLVRATKERANDVGDITADAFREDPFNRWLFGRADGMANAFRALARHVYCPRGLAYTLYDAGAAMWMMPGGDLEPPLAAKPALLWAIMGKSSRGAYARANRAMSAMEKAHPTMPHVYLFTIGVRRAQRGKGLGRKLIAPVLTACDREGLPAYLENSNPANRGFYGSCGFERIGMIEAEAGAPPLEAMLRQPRAL